MARAGRVFLLILVILIAGEVWMLLSHRNGGTPKTDRLAEIAEASVSACSAENDHAVCYDREIPKRTEGLTFEDSFAVTASVQRLDPSYAYCHVLGHKLSARETKKDPSQWMDVITRCPSGVCSNGCIHGAFQERFRADALNDAEIQEILPDLRAVCRARGKWNPTGIEQASCYHALGHLLMYVTSADLRKSARLCDAIEPKVDGSDYTQVCYDGVFMQIFQPLEPEDFALIRGKEPTSKTVRNLCWQFSGRERSSCWSESWPLFREAFLGDGRKLEAHCQLLSGDQADRCFNAVIYALIVQFRFDLSSIESFCNAISEIRRGRCYASTASRLIETDWNNIDTSVSWCGRALAGPVQDACFQELVDYSEFNFHKDSPEAAHLCASLPVPWSGKCQERQRTRGAQ